MHLHRDDFICVIQETFKENTGDYLNKRVSGILIDVFAESIKKVMAKGDKVTIRGFGTFEVRTRNSKAYPNPSKRGEKVIKPPTIYAAFSAGKELTKVVKETFDNESKKDIQENGQDA
jgi:DNA-binding protein HU-beta